MQIPEHRVCPILFPSQKFQNGGAERDRTVDPLLAKQVLSQLSYSPTVSSVPEFVRCGGPGKIRTSDLTLIRGAL